MKISFQLKYFFSLVLIIFFIFIPIVSAKNITLDLGWDANNEPDMGGYAVFIKKGGTSDYNYEDPKDPVCTIAEDGKCYTDLVNKLCGYRIVFEAIDGELATYYFVARAYDTEDPVLWSENSNEISYTVDLRVLPAPVITNFIYDDATKIATFTFTQDQDERVVIWELYMGNTSGGPYPNKVGELTNPPLTTPYSISWEVPGDGSYYFVIVGFTSEVYSVNSNQVDVVVENHPSRVKNFKIKDRIW